MKSIKRGFQKTKTFVGQYGGLILTGLVAVGGVFIVKGFNDKLDEMQDQLDEVEGRNQDLEAQLDDHQAEIENLSLELGMRQYPVDHDWD
jgi:predicted nuclease with TOPRIM domain